MRYFSKDRSHSCYGFSLIELMVVIAILSAVISLSLPTYNRLKIKAARVEMKQNTRTISALAQTYHADNSTYPPSSSYGIVSTYAGTLSFTGCGDHPNSLKTTLGFSVTTPCNKLRYTYDFIPEARSYYYNHPQGPSSDSSKYFTLHARSYYDESSSMFFGSGTNSYGSVPVNPIFCDLPSSPFATYDAYYSDRWTMTESGALFVVEDAIKGCT